MSGQQPWWAGAVGYEIYPRSFADGNGDGIGDLAGIRARLPHVVDLGVEAIWIAPFYPSPGLDHGYDVSDYTDVAPHHGSLDDFDALVGDARDLGLRVMVDLVPNHTSSRHRWFHEAVSSRDNPYRDYYIWRDPGPDGGPPNNWVSHFGGPAWTLDDASGQYYLHLFLPEQPDLNWANPAVADEFDDILRFWCERGVSGFRIDVAHCIVKDPAFRDNPQLREITNPNDPRDVFTAYAHLHDLDQDANAEVFRRWNRVVAPYGALLVGEVGADDPSRIAHYVAAGDGLHTVFYLEPVWMEWEPAALLAKLRTVHDQAPDGISWVTDNHDNSRSVTRYGGDSAAAARSLAVTTFLFGLGGVPFLYQGQELGLTDGKVDPGDFEDPMATRNVLSEEVGRGLWGGVTGRDGCRTAMPWNAGHENGFTTAPHAWLRAAPRALEETVAGQRGVAGAPLARYRELLAARRSSPDLWRAPLVWLETSGAVVAGYTRGRTAVVANLGRDPASVDLPTGNWSVLFETRASRLAATSGAVEVPAEASVILRTDRS